VRHSFRRISLGGELNTPILRRYPGEILMYAIVLAVQTTSLKKFIVSDDQQLLWHDPQSKFKLLQSIPQFEFVLSRPL